MLEKVSPGGAPAGEAVDGAYVEIEGMNCGACVNAVKSALASLPAGSVVSAEVEVGFAKLQIRADLVTPAKVLEAIEDCGFDARLRDLSPKQRSSAELKETTPVSKAADVGPRRVLLSVPGMVCSNCVGWVTSAVELVAGLQAVTAISLQRKTVEVLLTGGLAGVLQILEEMGFPAKLLDAPPAQAPPGASAGAAALAAQSASLSGGSLGRIKLPAADTSLLRVRGMSCAACASTVERAARRVPGVSDAAVSVLGHSALLTWAHGCPANPDAVSAAIRAAGYPTEVVSSGSSGASRVAFRVSGIVCAGCPGRIVIALQSVKGVGAVEADEFTGKVSVEFEPALTGPRTLLDKLTHLGYGAELWLEETACDVDAQLAVTEAAEWRNLFLWALLFTIPVVLFGMAFARELLDQPPPPLWRFSGAPAAVMGMPGMPSMPPHHDIDNSGTITESDMPLSSAPAPVPVHADGHGPIATGGMAGMGGMGSHTGRSLPLMSVVTWALATPVQFWCAARFYTGAWRALRMGVANMDVLVVVGTGCAYAYSALVVLLRALLSSAAGHAVGDPMFDTPAMLITFILLGKWLEAAAKGRTHFALRALSALQPQTAVLVSADDSADGTPSEREVPSALLQLGDLVKVEPGRRVAVDGLVVSGSVSVDESMLTGESVLVLKEPGSRVVAGSTPAEGSAVVRATAVGGETGIARIVELVRFAQASKPPIQAAADAVSAVFVPTIVAVACVTFAAWFGAAESGAVPASWMSAEGPFLFSFLFGIATVVIACPCALGLAVPTVVMVATGLGASNGILFKGGAPLQSASRVTAVAFDKTGTLTEGAPAMSVVELLPHAAEVLSHWEEQIEAAQAALSVAAALESDSLHPVAKAVVKHAGGEALPEVFGRVGVLGRGVAGVVGRLACMVGSPAWAEEAGAGPLSEATAARIAELEGTGHTVLLLCAGEAPPELLWSLFPEDAEPGGGNGGEDGGGEGGGGECSGGFLLGRPGKGLRVEDSVFGGASSCRSTEVGILSPSSAANSFRSTEVGVFSSDSNQDFLPSACSGDFAATVSGGGADVSSRGSGLVRHARNHWSPQSTAGGGSAAACGNAKAGGDASTSASLSTVAEGDAAAAAAAVDYGRVPPVAAAAARGGPVALLAMRDGVKPDAREAVAALRAMGVACVILTGDNPRAAAAVAAAVGINDVRAGLLPEEKLAELRGMREAGLIVAMVGDGVNDAPALAEADVGVAIGAGAEVAVETAGIVLVHSRVCDVPATLHLARVAMRRIRLNLLLSLIFNGLGVPFAAGVLYPVLRWRLPPEAAAAAMAASSVCVVLSSLELRRFRSPHFARAELQ